MSPGATVLITSGSFSLISSVWTWIQGIFLTTSRSDVLVSARLIDSSFASLPERTFWTCRWRGPVNPQTPRWAASARPTRCGWSLNPQAALKENHQQKCDFVRASAKPKSSSCLNTADYFHCAVSFVRWRAALCLISPQGAIGETLGSPLLSLGAVALVHSHGFSSAERKYSKYFSPPPSFSPLQRRRWSPWPFGIILKATQTFVCRHKWRQICEWMKRVKPRKVDRHDFEIC